MLKPDHGQTMDMLGQAAGAGATPRQVGSGGNPLVDWLLTEGWEPADAKELFHRLCLKMIEIGLPMLRVRLTLRMLHPQFLGITYTWLRPTGEIEEFLPPYEVLQSDMYLKSPYAGIFQGAGGVRRRLDIPGGNLDFPILEDLRAQGATDYVALPLSFSDGKLNAITFATDRPGGFATAELAVVFETLPLLARLLELHALRRTTKTILDTYLGRLSGERVLKGLIKRGDGENIHAVIWFSDLRGSTALADRMPQQAFLALLNDYFECMAGAVLANGGEVLRFIGDAALAIFPILSVSAHPQDCPEHIRVCATAVAAARDAVERVRLANERREAGGERPIRFGIGLHLGDVMYGNIGTPDRLEFSVIGAAANEAARIESLCKALHTSVLVSEEVAQVVPESLVSVGVHGLRGVRQPRELFTLP
jgi:adenylate cyclase